LLGKGGARGASEFSNLLTAALPALDDFGLCGALLVAHGGEQGPQEGRGCVCP
jgi:hypothetical protein